MSKIEIILGNIKGKIHARFYICKVKGEEISICELSKEELDSSSEDFE